MKFSKHLLIAILLTLIYSGSILGQSKRPLIRFGLIADIQYANAPTEDNRYYANSLKKLKNCVDDLNRQKVEFTINLGDMVDKRFEDMDPVLKELKKLKGKVYNTTGNHDYTGVTDNKILFKKLDMPEEYYSFKKKDWLFIMLNTNEIASYSNIINTHKAGELWDMNNKILNRKKENGQEWNGGIGKMQVRWLTTELETAMSNGLNVIICCHHPLYPAGSLNALNDIDMINMLSNYPCIKAIFSGHNHTGDYALYNNIHFVTAEGMVETESDSAYSIVEIFDNRIVLTGKGRAKSHSLPVN